MDLELLVLSDGTIRLAFWDSVEGKDRIFILGDGRAYVEIEQPDGSETRELVDLVGELRSMVAG